MNAGVGTAGRAMGHGSWVIHKHNCFSFTSVGMVSYSCRFISVGMYEAPDSQQGYLTCIPTAQYALKIGKFWCSYIHQFQGPHHGGANSVYTGMTACVPTTPS